MKQTWLSAAYFVGPADLTGQWNRGELESTVAELDVTTFASGGAKEVIGGLETVMFTGSGFWEAGGTGKIDDLIESDKRLLLPHTVGPSNSGAAVSATAYVCRALRTRVKYGTTVGEVLPWELSASGSGQLARGAFLLASTTTVDSDADGTAVQVGAVPAGNRMIGNLHVLSAAGTTPTLAVTVESDDTADFDGSETTRLTFTTATDSPSTWYDTQRTDGSEITDMYWRVVLNVEGSGAEFTAVVAIGVNIF